MSQRLLEERAGTNVLAFSKLVGQPLTRPQAQAVAFNTPHRFVVVVAPRQGGKSMTLAIRASQWAMSRAGHRVLIISATEKSAKGLLAKARAIVTGPRLRTSLVEDQTELIRLSNGSEIRSVSASEGQIRGQTVDLLIIDEAAMIANEILEAAFPTVAARSAHARVILASSANRSDNLFYDLAMRGEGGRDPQVITHRWSLTDCPWITDSFLDAQRSIMTPSRFAAEYEGIFASGADALFTRSSLERATRDIRLWTLATLEGPARLSAGLDWGVTVDRSAFAAVARLPQAGERTFAVVAAQRWPAGVPHDDVIADVVASPAHIAKLTSESVGVGADSTTRLFNRYRERPSPRGGGRRSQTHVVLTGPEWLRLGGPRRAKPDPNLMPRPVPGQEPQASFATSLRRLHTSNASKVAAYASLRWLIDSGRLLIPRDADELIRELMFLRVEVLTYGDRIEARRGHDDLADALAFALTPHNARGEWRTWVGDLADPRVTGSPPAEPVPTVHPLPWEPVLQSVAGPELSVPSGVVLNPPPLSAAQAAAHASQKARRKERNAQTTHR